MYLGPHVAGLLLCGAAIAGEITDIGDLPPADVIILGEVHDNPIHHQNQTHAVAALAPKALVFEMFGPEAALRVTQEARADEAALAEALGWADLGWPDFAYYAPIFFAAPNATVFGGALPRQDVRRAVTDGAAEVFGRGAPIFGIERPLDPEEQTTRETLQGEAHCGAMPDDILPGMVEAQRLRDAALARAVIAALAESGGPVALITGNGHARKDWGVPRMLARAAPDTTVLSVGQFEEDPGPDAPFDLWLVTEPAEREDPCATFR